MSDRGQPPDASFACPFVALEDDRDSRSTRPDHRHRCFAELRPAPRAAAHQEAYCLSAGFATCPTFVDWARREAARPKLPVEPVESDLRTHRDPRRDWAAPPPWATTAAATGATVGGAAAASDATVAGEGPAGQEAPVGPVPPTAPPDRALEAPAIPPVHSTQPADVAAPSFLATRATEPPRPTPTTPPPSRSTHPAVDLDDELEADLGDDEAWVEAEPAVEEPPMRRFGAAGGHTRYDDTSVKAPPPRRRPPADPGAPAWEKPRRYEAYPSLRTRAGLSGVPPLLAAGLVVVAVAAALFFIPPFLLGLGDDSEATPTPSSSIAAASATPAASPTPTPSPTPFVYVVKSGDTLSKIANEFGVSLDDLIAANKATLPDPDKLQVGDELIIPPSGAEPSPSPEVASPSP